MPALLTEITLEIGLSMKNVMASVFDGDVYDDESWGENCRLLGVSDVSWRGC